MTQFNVFLAFAVLACVWVFASAKNFSSQPSRRGLGTLAAAMGVSLLCAAAHLSNEWAVRDAASLSHIEPNQAYEHAKAMGGEAGVLGAYTAGILEASFKRNREDAAGLGLASVFCLVAGLGLGRRRSRQSSAPPDTADPEQAR
ncbi:hypothetical protein ACG0Z6_10825 [Roseateles sp. BYS180W]|uniref:Uncharacterized protein n=1 Tax=Roseateles rivi TaxID=3299028 RepID=A0ABW7FWP5_9BURK